MKYIALFFSLITPRFINEWVMLEETEDAYKPVCSEVDIRPGETFDAMAKAKSFTWFGVCLFASFGEPVAFDRKRLSK